MIMVMASVGVRVGMLVAMLVIVTIPVVVIVTIPVVVIVIMIMIVAGMMIVVVAMTLMGVVMRMTHVPLARRKHQRQAPNNHQHYERGTGPKDKLMEETCFQDVDQLVLLPEHDTCDAEEAAENKRAELLEVISRTIIAMSVSHGQTSVRTSGGFPTCRTSFS
jgi:hypothetical protein